MSYGYGTHYQYRPAHREEDICPTCSMDAESEHLKAGGAYDSTDRSVLWPCPEYLSNEFDHLRNLISREASSRTYLYNKALSLLNTNRDAAVPSLSDDEIRFLSGYINEHVHIIEGILLNSYMYGEDTRAKVMRNAWDWLTDENRSVLLVKVASV